MMRALTHAQWSILNAFAIRIHQARSREDLIRLAVAELPSVIGAGWAGWNEHDETVRIDEVYVTEPYTETMSPLIPIVNELMASHPVVEGLDLIGDLKLHDGVFSLTDFKSVRQLKNVPMWWEIYRHVESQHQLVSQFDVSENRGVALTVNADREFTEEQRAMIQVLTGHFLTAYQGFLREREVLANAGFWCDDEFEGLLTRREKEVLPYLLGGKTNPEIAIILGISPRTVEKHVSSILEKAKVENRRALMAQQRR